MECFKAAIEQGVQLWDVPCYHETRSEDNDSCDEEEESMDEETKKSIETISQLMISQGATIDYFKIMKNLKKGLTFFMNQEKDEIKKVK